MSRLLEDKPNDVDKHLYRKEELRCIYLNFGVA